MKKGISAYQEANVNNAAMENDPHLVITLLMQGALDRIAQAKGLIQRNEIAQKGLMISKAIGIIEGLQSSLDIERGGELAENLYRLYDYFCESLIEANKNNKLEKLDEVHLLLSDILSSWLQIPEDVKQQYKSESEATKLAGAGK